MQREGRSSWCAADQGRVRASLRNMRVSIMGEIRVRVYDQGCVLIRVSIGVSGFQAEDVRVRI